MIKSSLKAFLLLCVLSFVLVTKNSFAQEVSIAIDRTEIGSNELLQIVATVRNERLKGYSGFPDLEGFRKSGTSSSTNTNIINGKVTSSQSITQSYSPNRKGSFKVPAFSMTINGKKTNFPGATIKVGEAVQRRASDPFADFWGNPSRGQNKEFVDVKDDAFFAISPNKNEVYVGEGFTLNISLYVALSNRAQMSFYKIGDQLAEILKNVKPTNCWEENFGIDQIDPEYITLNGKQYRQYKIYEGAFFPLNSEDISIPSTGLKMVKYKEAKNPTFFGRNKQEDYKTFYSKEKIVKVKELPPHPLKEGVAVGNYRLKEAVSQQAFETGQSFNYQFKIEGQGNIASLGEPLTKENEDLMFYPPSVRQNITRSNGRVYGSKTFEYFIEPQEPGFHQMKDYLNWVYFNPRLEKYDTLRPELSMKVIGESKKNAMIGNTALGGFYNLIGQESNEIRRTTEGTWIRIVANVSIVLLLVSAAVVAVVKRKK